MTTIAAGSSATITVAAGGSVSIASNGGFWNTTETVAGVARTSTHGPTAHTRVFGPYLAGATVMISNVSVNAFNYVDYELSAVALGTISVGSAQTFTLADRGTLTVSNPSGFWQVVATPAIGNPSTAIYGPGAGNVTFGPYAVGATLVVTNQSGAALVSSVVGSGGGGASLPAFTLQAETTAIASAMTASGQTPNAQRQYTYNYWIKKLKTAGVWAKLAGGGLWIVGDTAGQSRINLIAPGTNDLTVVGAPVFTAPAAAFKGTANTTSAGYLASANTMALDTGVMLSQLYNAGTFSMGVYVGTNTNLAFEFGAQDGTAGALLYAGNTSNLPAARMCSTNQNYGTVGQVAGDRFTAAVRTSATACSFYAQGQLIGTSSADNLALPTTGTRTLRFLTANTATGVSVKPWFGGFVALQPLSATDIDLLYRAMRSIIESIQYADVLVNEMGYAPTTPSAQVIVYGWTFQGVHAAFEAARQGKTVALVGGWRDIAIGSIGGVSANGLNRTDLNTRSSIGGLANLTLSRCNAAAGLSDVAAALNTDPAIVSFICRQMLDPARTGGQNIAVYQTGGIVSAVKSGTTLQSITTLDGRTFSGSQFIDASYEGDLIAASGVDTAIGREAAGSGTESFNGYRGMLSASRPSKSAVFYNIDPFITPGVQGSGTIALVNPTYTAETVGQADSLSQAFNFRLTFTATAAGSKPLFTAAPSGYSSATFEFYGRLAAAFVANSTTMAVADIYVIAAIVNGKLDYNGQDYYNHALDYITAPNYTAREAAWQAHTAYTKQSVYYFAYDGDSRISGQPIRTTLAGIYLPTSNYLDPHPNDEPYWPGQLYVREMRRLVGDAYGTGPAIYNGNDLQLTDGTTPRSVKTVGTACYDLDSHPIQRVAENVTQGTYIVNLEGTFHQSTGGTDGISPIPLEACLPKAAQCGNLSAAFCLSTTHVAFGAIRMEFSTAQIAQSLGMAAALAIDTGSSLQAIDYTTLRARLLASPSYSGEVAPVLPQIN